MTRPIAISLVFALLLSSALANAAALIVPDRAQHKRDLAAFDGQIAAIYALAARADTKSLTESLAAVAANPDADRAVQEHLLETSVLALSGIVPDAETRALVGSLRNRPVDVYVRLTEEHAQAIVPLYDVAAAVRLTEHAWSVADARRLVTAALKNNTWTPAAIEAVPPGMDQSAWREGSARAFREVDGETLSGLREELLFAYAGQPQLDAVVLAVAANTGDPEFFLALAGRAEPPVLMQAVAEAGQVLDADAAFDVLLAYTGRPQAASAALLQLGRLAERDERARGWLIARLGHATQGGSAALALARLHDDAIVGDMRSVILGSGPELEKLRAALVLRLSDLPLAQQVRQQLLLDGVPGDRLLEALR